jgi:hypothetical protein
VCFFSTKARSCEAKAPTVSEVVAGVIANEAVLWNVDHNPAPEETEWRCRHRPSAAIELEPATASGPHRAKRRSGRARDD